MEQEKQLTSLPENAYRELAPGEEYTPMLPASAAPAEVTPYSVGMGIVMAVVFSAAAAYLGLKIGQVFEAAIPIAIIAVGMGSVLGKRNMLGQNVIIQSIGASSGVIVAGAIFTLPALYILGLDAAFYQIFLSSLFGGLLGIVLLIPFRSYFVKEMHGKYPFPKRRPPPRCSCRARRAARRPSCSPWPVPWADCTISWCRLSGHGRNRFRRASAISARCAPTSSKVVFGLNTGAAVLGLGYIIGLKYATIITAGSCLVWFLVVPLVGSVIPDAASVSPEQLFKDFGRPIGIGGIAMAGLVGIVRQAGIIRQALGLAVKELGGKKTAEQTTVRTQRDLTMRLILTVVIATLAALLVFFQFGVLGNWAQTLVALAIVFVIAFLFTTVAANAIAIVGTNPVSGMTLMTLILSSLVLVSIGLSGKSGMTAALVIGGVVCTALSMAGGFITDLKIGYWIGTTPAKQEAWKFLGTAVSAATVAGVMIVLNRTYGFVGEGALVAPQANCDGGRDPALDGGRHDAVGALFHRRRAGAGAHLDRRAGAGLLAGDVHPHGAERPAGGGRSGGVVRLDPLEGRCGEQGSARPRYTHCVGLHRRRCADGCRFSRAEIRGRRLVLRAVGVVERRRMVGVCDVCGSDRLYGLAHDACEARIGVII